MRRIFILAWLIFLCVGHVFAVTTATYFRENDSKIKGTAHQRVAVPAYLQSANYSDLIRKGQEYEKAGKWIYAYGTYVDASAISNGDTEANNKAEDILSVISNGKPGKGSFDVFTLYDKWVDLITESEKYFTEFPAFEIELKEPVQKEIHYDTRTADYEVTINTYFTEKANNLYEALQKGFERAKKDDWKIKPWFIHESYKPETIKAAIISSDDFKARTPALEKMKTVVSNGQKEGIAIASWLNTYNPYENDKRSANNTYYCSQKPAFFADMYLLAKTWDNSVHFLDGHVSFYEIEIELCDKNGKSLIKSNRVTIQELGDSSEGTSMVMSTGQTFGKTRINFKNMDRNFMAKVDAGEVTVKATGLFLHYGLLTVPSSDVKFTDDLISNLIRKLPEMKIDLNKTIVYNSNEMLVKLDDINIEKFLQSEPKEDEDKLIYGYFYGYENMTDDDIDHPHYKALANRMSIEQGLTPAHYQDQDGEKIYDSSKWIFDNVGTVSGYDRKSALRKTWASIKTDETANGYYVEKYSGRETDDIRLCRKDVEFINNLKKERERIAADELSRKQAEEKAAIQRQEESKRKRILNYLENNMPKMVGFKETKFEIMESLVSEELYNVVMEENFRNTDSYPYSTNIFRIFEFCNRLSELYGYESVYKLDGESEFEDEVLWITEGQYIIDRQNEINSIVSRLTIDENANGFRLPNSEEFCQVFGFKMKKKAISSGGMGDVMNIYSLSKAGKPKMNLFSDNSDEESYYGEICFYKPYFVVSIVEHCNNIKLKGFGYNLELEQYDDIKVTGFAYNIESGRITNKMQGYDLKGQFRLARTIAK